MSDGDETLELFTWDTTCDAGYVTIDAAVVVQHQVEVTDPGWFIVDTDDNGRIHGIEVLSAKSPAEMFNQLHLVFRRCVIPRG